MNENPYAAPQAQLVFPSARNDAERIRKEHIKHESSVKSVGVLYWLGAILIFGVGAATFGSQPDDIPYRLGYLAGSAGFGALLAWAGAKIRKLEPVGKIPVGIFSGLGLLGFPFGTVVNAYILYLVFGAKGKFIFSDGYKQVIAATPHIKYRTSIIVWIFVGLLVLLLLAVAGLAFARRWM